MEGTFCLVLHSHLPWLARHGAWPVGEDWLYQAWAHSYLPVVDVLHRLADRGHPDHDADERIGAITSPLGAALRPVAACPAGETTQSTKRCPSAALTCGWRCGFTGMTPYWLNRRGSPSTAIPSPWRLRNASQVPRSARV